MPELPEVQTTVDELKDRVVGRKITDVWTDWPKMIKQPETFSKFKQAVVGEKIQAISRRGKNVIFHLSGQKTLLIHQKMTGHLLVGRWRRGHDDNDDDKNKGQDQRPATAGKWVSAMAGPLRDDRLNGYIHLLFWLGNSWQLALSDLRKFAKVALYSKAISRDLTKAAGIPELDDLGPDPFSDEFSFEKFKNSLKNRTAAIKTVLMDQKVVAGIGNIYADEILWAARVHPATKVDKLSADQLKAVYNNIRPILERAIKLGGTSVGDYRKPDGTQGGYQQARKVYGKEGKPCPRCGAAIKRIKLGQRSAHFCPACQKQFQFKNQKSKCKESDQQSVIRDQEF